MWKQVILLYIKLEGGQTKSLTYFPYWLRTIQKIPLIPEKDCQVTKDSDNSSLSLKCNAKTVQSGIQI
ncbi:hypothetical protein OVS_01965 [Mycoplasma ovis str. Michigan]|uniref:Uncharacterized protein n=1 Tax=Mycoplasma ovis str. Michigan TaxID=1415773 RepID=A0ABN4BQV3_9MOLU|nr:hypothetical protein [Mycoplasma ovis]AHC40263.1 hypothetical protein OVS_01965 [Mycoplasma ovis str. Michigan]